MDIQKKEQLVSSKEKLNAKKEQLFTDLIATVDEHLEKIETQIKETKSSHDKIVKRILEQTISIDKKQSLLKEAYTELAEMPEDKMRRVLEDSKKLYSDSILKKQNSLKSIEEEHSKKDLQLAVINKSLETAYKEISNIKSGDFYIEYVSKSENACVTEEVLSQWKDLLKEENAKQNKFKVQIQKSNQELNVLKERNVAIEQTEVLQKQHDEKTTQIHQIEKQRARILDYLETGCSLNETISQSCDQDVILIFEQSFKQQKSLKEEQEKRQTALDDYISVLYLIEKFLDNKRIEEELSNLKKKEEEKSLLRNACKKEIEGIELHLEKFVDSYFEIDLINRLYNAIDPHPDYKEIQFKCDFKQKNPRLKVLVNSREDGKESIVPNLYFSTAQINILSFCIFLAKALFATDDEGKSMDCIFIDDPIQALDDINILSIIDLLRNVAFSMDKQIVLTTHDRNFFELLQKKVPDTLFNSRFITLPERGKFAYV